MADIVLKDRNGNPVTYSGIETVTFDTPTEGEQTTFTHGVEQTGKEVELDLADGDQIVTADEGYLLKELTILKPETLAPENIRKGTVVGGVTGDFLGDTEEVTVDLNFPVGTVEADILPLTSRSDFVLDNDFGTNFYCAYDIPASYALTVGETYTVYWDGASYECVGQDVSILGGDFAGAVGIGNGAPFGLAGNDEPFIILMMVFGDVTTITHFSLTDTEAGGTHAIRISQMVEGGNADMVVTPSADDKVLSRVTITKPETLVPENIAKDVEIGGVVGTFEGGGSDPGAGAYNVKVIDYDGTILAEKNLDSGEVFTLPDAPEHERLVFDGWSSHVTITDNTVTVENQDITIGPMYHTASGATEIDIVLTKPSGLTFTFSSSMLTNMTSIDWGDGTTDSTLTHTYSDYGEYTVKVYGITAVAAGSTSGGIVNVNSTLRYVVKNAFFSEGITSIGSYALYACYSLTNVTIPKGVTSIGSYALCACYSLTSVTIPKGVTSINGNMFYSCNSLASIVIPKGVTSIGDYAFHSCNLLTSITFPDGITSIGTYVFRYCFSHIKYDFSACSNIPALSSVLAFSDINTTCQILVPSSLYDEWTAATNWSNRKNYIVAV